MIVPMSIYASDYLLENCGEIRARLNPLIGEGPVRISAGGDLLEVYRDDAWVNYCTAANAEETLAMVRVADQADAIVREFLLDHHPEKARELHLSSRETVSQFREYRILSLEAGVALSQVWDSNANILQKLINFCSAYFNQLRFGTLAYLYALPV